mmetsp:Transcript_27907/g.60580  ORF Transcript_27907/g.60580 Transcript_27907/m.60580 type:complete len:1313 (+) Transcript_27907:3-3941(+)
MIERRQSDDSASSRATAEVEAKVGVVSQQVADITARLLEVEGGLDFARESTIAPLCEVSAVSAASEAASAAAVAQPTRPPLPPGGGSGEDRLASAPIGALEERLEALAEHLELFDEVVERVTELERRGGVGGEGGENGDGEVEAARDGPPQRAQASDEAECYKKELSEKVATLAAKLETEERLRADAPFSISELSSKVAVLEAHAEKATRVQAQLDGLSEDIVNLKARSVASEQSGDASEEVGKLEARLAASEQTVGGLQGDFSQLAATGKEADHCQRELSEKVASLQAQVQKTNAAQGRLDDLSEEIGKLKAQSQSLQQNDDTSQEVNKLEARLTASEKVVGALQGDLSKRAQVSEEAEHSHKELVDKVGALASKLEAQAGEEAVRFRQELSEKVASLQVQAEKATATQAEASEVAERSQKELSERIAALSAKLEAEEKLRADAPLSMSEISGKINALEVQVQKVVAVQDTDAIPSKLAERLNAIEERVENTRQSVPADAAPNGTDELPSKLAERLKSIEERVEANGKSLTAEDMEEKVRLHTQGKLEDFAAKVEGVLGDISKHKADLADTNGKVLALSERLGAMGDVEAQAPSKNLKALEEKLAEVEGRIEEDIGKARADAKCEAKDLRHLIEEASTKQEKAASAATAALSARDRVGEERQRQLDDLRERLGKQDEKLKNAEGGLTSLQEAGASVSDVDRRLRDAEQKLSSLMAGGGGGGSSGPASTEPAEDERLRLQVQSQVAELTALVSKELGGLSSHQEELVGMRTTVNALSAKVEACSAAPLEASQASTKDLSEKVDGALQRLKVAEDTTNAIKKDLGLQKVGITVGGASGSPMADIESKLELLSEQMAELQSKAWGSRPSKAEFGSRDASLNLSITEQTPCQGGAQGEGSMNFSLTEQMDRLGGGSLNFSVTQQSTNAGEGSLNFSVTQQNPCDGSLSVSDTFGSGPVKRSVGEMSKLEPITSPANSASGERSGAEVPASESPQSASERSTSGGSKPSKSPKGDSSMSSLAGLPALNVRGGRQNASNAPSGDAVDSLVGSGKSGKAAKVGIVLDSHGADGADAGARAGDALDALEGALAGAGAGSRPRPSPLKLEEDRGPLASVAEEPQEAGEQSQSRQSSSSGQQRKAVASPPTALESPGAVSSAASTPLGKSTGGLEASCQSNLEVSQSGNEVSVGGDYSVEDSLELEKCDHVEVVKGNEVSPAGGSGSGSLPIAKKAEEAAPPPPPKTPAGGDALDALLPKGAVKSPPKAKSPTKGAKSPAKSSPKADEYGDESFDAVSEDDMSVPESIEEESMQSGSDQEA